MEDKLEQQPSVAIADYRVRRYDALRDQFNETHMFVESSDVAPLLHGFYCNQGTYNG